MREHHGSFAGPTQLNIVSFKDAHKHALKSGRAKDAVQATLPAFTEKGNEQTRLGTGLWREHGGRPSAASPVVKRNQGAYQRSNRLFRDQGMAKEDLRPPLRPSSFSSRRHLARIAEKQVGQPGFKVDAPDGLGHLATAHLAQREP